MCYRAPDYHDIVCLMMIFDLSAALGQFIDHDIILSRLHYRFGFTFSCLYSGFNHKLEEGYNVFVGVCVHVY